MYRGGHFRIGRFNTAPRRSAAMRGFTIIEVLIVLAVTGLLFVSAAVLIAGKQNQTAFDQAIRQTQAQIQQTINEVAAGYYPNTTFQCTAGGAGPVLSSGSAAQGSNSGCIFLGKAMQFKVAGTDPEQYATYGIAALQNYGSCSSESACLAQAKPLVVAPSVPSHTTAGYPNVTTMGTLEGGLTTVSMWYNDGGGNVPVGAVAFLNSLLQQGSGDNNGSGQVNVVPVNNTTLGATKDATIELMNADAGNKLATSPVNPTGGVFVCFASGGTNQSGLITIGTGGRQLSVRLDIKSNKTCS